LVGILLESSAKHRAVIMLIPPPIKNEKKMEGPATKINCPMKRKKFEPMLAPKP